MEVRVEGSNVQFPLPGIGVDAAGKKWILRPPGDAMAPSSGDWKWEEVSVFNGGVGTVYRPDDLRYFVEGVEGTSCGNERLTDPLFGMSANIYLFPLTSHNATVSDPFIFKDTLEQLKVEGGSLTRRARRLSKTGLVGAKTGTAGRIDTTSAMPPASQGDYWGLLTAHSGEEKVVACRIASDVSSWFFEVDNIRQSVVMWRDENGDGMSNAVSSLHIPSTSRIEPAEAPRYSRWDRNWVAKSETIYITYPNPGAFIPGAPATRTTDGMDSTTSFEYEEKCDFSRTAVFRRYVDFAGEVREETIKYEDKSDISVKITSGYYGFDREGYIDFDRFRNGLRKAKTERLATLSLDGVPTIKPYEFIVEHESKDDGDRHADSKFWKYAYSSTTGQIIGFTYAGLVSAADIQTRKTTVQLNLEHILMHDSQFGVAASIRVEAKTILEMEQGHPRVSSDSHDIDWNDDVAVLRHDTIVGLTRDSIGWGDQWAQYFFGDDYVNTHDRTDELKVEIIFYGPNGKDSATIAVPTAVHDELFTAMSQLLNELSVNLNNRGDPDWTVTHGTRQNGYFREQAVKEVLDEIFNYVVGVYYSKDPKTGAGFFSCTWDDGVTPAVRRNKVTGPWGWAPASSRTPIADNAVVLSTTSV
jgi:hypothetical protein